MKCNIPVYNNPKRLWFCGSSCFFVLITAVVDLLFQTVLPWAVCMNRVSSVSNPAASLLPSVSYGRLEQFTELVVSPKSRTGFGNLSGSSPGTSQHQHPNSQSNYDLSSSPGSSLESSVQETSHYSTTAYASSVPQSPQWGGIADLKSLLRYMLKGPYDPVKEVPPVPDIPALLTDSVYRVCGTPPNSLCTINHATTGVVHLFPWGQGVDVGSPAGHSAVTYGLLSKVPSPKELKNKAKQAVDNKKNNGVPKAAAAAAAQDKGDEVKEEEAVVVRLVCHHMEKLAGKQRCANRGEIHCGRVWVSIPSIGDRGMVDYD